jgi:hypothetical protein
LPDPPPRCEKSYRDGDCSAQPDWQVSWFDVQADRQVPPAVALRAGAGLLLGLGGATGATGTTQVVRQLDACALQFIMQLVTVEVWASRIRSSASAPCAHATPITAAIKTTAMLRIPPPRVSFLMESNHESERAAS